MSEITISTIRSRPVASAAIAIAAVGAATILGALILQYGLGLQPCPLCLEQRYAYYFAIPLALMVLVGDQVGASRKVLFAALVAIALGMLWNAKTASNRLMVQSADHAARSLGVTLRSFPVQGPEDLQPTLNKVSEEQLRALLVAGDPLLFDVRADLIAFSLANRIPTFHTWPEEAVDGAVVAYGAELADEYPQAAVYVAKILAGAAPADLPVNQAMRFQFVLNMKTAKAISLKIPDVILLRADKVIE